MSKMDFESSYPMKSGFNTVYGSAVTENKTLKSLECKYSAEDGFVRFKFADCPDGMDADEYDAITTFVSVSISDIVLERVFDGSFDDEGVIAVDLESGYPFAFELVSEEPFEDTLKRCGIVEEDKQEKPVIDFELFPYLCGFFKQFLTLDPDDVDSDYTATSSAIYAACEKAYFYGYNTDGVRLIGDDAAGFIYTDRNSGKQYVDIFTPCGELDVPYNAATIAAVIEHYVPGLVCYTLDIKKRERGYNNTVRFLNELLNVPTELIEDALDYIGGEN